MAVATLTQLSRARMRKAWAANTIPPPTRSRTVLPTFRGNAARAQTITDSAWLLSGPAETGKTWAGLYRLDSLARAYPDQYILARKIRATMDATVLRTWRHLIALRGGVEVYGGHHPKCYRYENGAVVWIVGFDNPDKILSGEFGAAYVNQAEELHEADWETLSTRVTGRGSVSPHPMIFGDCNPSAEDHWIKHRADSHALTVLDSRHEDNPTLYDDAGQITAQGKRTMAVLDALTGVRYWRLRRGLWVGSEGQHFETFDPAVHVVAPPRVTGDWVVWGALDYGYHHPMAIGVLGLSPAGDVVLLGETGGRKLLIRDHVERYLAILTSLGIAPRVMRSIQAGHDVWAVRGGDDRESIADKWSAAVRDALGYTALPLVRATIDRINGAQAIQDGFAIPHGDPERGIAPRRPTLYLSERCPETIATIPRMVSDPHRSEDVRKADADAQGRGGDDYYDMLRYGVMGRPGALPTPRRSYSEEHLL